MPHIQSLVDTLKRALRADRVTYAEVARELGLSEASVKRMFSRGAFTLERFDAICRMVGLDLADLVRLQDEGERRISRLTREQEEELVADVRLLLVALLVRNRWGFEDIVREYAVSETECVRLLARLDRLRALLRASRPGRVPRRPFRRPGRAAPVPERTALPGIGGRPGAQARPPGRGVRGAADRGCAAAARREAQRRPGAGDAGVGAVGVCGAPARG